MDRFAKLTDVQLNEKWELQWNGIVLLAYEKPIELAQLSFEQVQKIRNSERIRHNSVAYK